MVVWISYSRVIEKTFHAQLIEQVFRTLNVIALGEIEASATTVIESDLSWVRFSLPLIRHKRTWQAWCQRQPTLWPWLCLLWEDGNWEKRKVKRSMRLVIFYIVSCCLLSCWEWMLTPIHPFSSVLNGNVYGLAGLSVFPKSLSITHSNKILLILMNWDTLSVYLLISFFGRSWKKVASSSSTC